MEPETRWRVGLIISALLLVFQISAFLEANKTYRKIKELETKIMQFEKTDFGKYPNKKLDEMRMKINSMERYLHTMPLVECGDRHLDRKLGE